MTGNVRLGVTLYSFNAEYYSYRYSVEECMKAAASLGPDQGVEIVGPQMIRGFPRLSSEFEALFKRCVAEHGLRPTAYGAYSDDQRITGRALSYEEALDYMTAQLRAAKTLGFPVVRVQPREVVLADLVPVAEKLGLHLGMEIHAPMKIEEMGELIERVEKISSPSLGFVPDCGIFCHSCADIYVNRFLELGVNQQVVDRILELWTERATPEQLHDEIERLGGDDLAQVMGIESFVYFGHSEPATLERIMPYIRHVHGKFFGIDESGTDSAVRFSEVVDVLQRGGFDGYISCEYEGHHWTTKRSALEQVRTLQTFLRTRLGG